MAGRQRITVCLQQDNQGLAVAMDNSDIVLGVIGGTGVYRLANLEGAEGVELDTPYGRPSGPVRVGRLAGFRVAFLARHGESHSVAPHRINYRANVHALHQLGVRRLLGINAVGGIGERMGPRVLAVPDQIIDYTHGRLASFCDVEGAKVEHVDFTHPYTPALRTALLRAGAAVGTRLVDGGTYGCTQGPRLETIAEIARLRRDGCDLVGMTGMPEAVLARELGIEYASLCLVANWAAGCGDEAEITMDEVMANMAAATEAVPGLLAALLAEMAKA
ncbi:methylthioadenosine phosphorylase [Aquimonas voraii]|uniref:Probable S-methyl-5'-thioinosine phosphorylase n=2 Tax=Aquimonas voraii TaxID=265719 RepID=A0A1G6UHG2_9GAMM|nr:methylthioadenosine phosphorylase [Aquimonas voraii]